MLDALRRYVDSLVGVTEVPRERAERIVADLSKRGELRARDLGKAAQDLVDRSARNRRELVRLVQKEITRQIHAVGLATRDDVERLERRLKRLESKQKAKAKPKGKPKPKPKPAPPESQAN